MQLLFPGFLWGLLGVSIPVLIHLLQLRRPRRVLFTNTGFIQQIEQKAGRRRLQDRLVLALRVLAVVGLVLAFCQPFVPARVAAGAGAGQPVQVLVDNSPSMQVRGASTGTLAESALGAARQLGRAYPADTRFELVGLPGGALTQNAFDQALAGLPAAPRRLGWGAARARQAWQSRAGGPLYVFSDFQKSEVPAAALRQLPTGREVVLVPQAGPATGNLLVDSVWLNDAFVRTRANLALHVRIRNGGAEAVADAPVKVQLAGRQVAAFQVSVAPGQSKETTVQVQLPDERTALGEVQLADAPVTFDNAYRFVLQPTAAVRVLEIGPAPLAQAAYQREPLFSYRYARPQQLNYNDLRQANLVLLTEPTAADASLREALGAVLRRGGSVAVVPPAAPAAHEAIGQLLRALGAGAVQWEAPATGEPVRQELALPDPRSAFFRDVFGAQPRQVALPTASPVLRLGGAGTDILRLRDGGGYLTEFAQGPGRLYVFAAPFASRYSDFASQSLFVPVLYRLAMLSYRTEQPLAYRIGQPALALRVPAPAAAATSAADAAPYRLVHDSLTLVPAQRQQGQELRLELPAELSAPGFYQLTRQGRPVATLAFNLARPESTLGAYSSTELRQLVGPGHSNVHVLDPGTGPEALLRYRAEQTGQPLWRYCLLLALGALLAEGLVLRRSRAAVPERQAA